MPAFGVKFHWNLLPDIPADVTNNTTENFKRYWYDIYDFKELYSFGIFFNVMSQHAGYHKE